MNVSLKQLRAFVSVAEAHGFTGAASRLGLTQSALSLLVKGLEAELGVRLFDRSTRTTRLSVAGADFFPLAVKVLQDLDQALASAVQLQEKQRGSVRIACTLLYGAGLMPNVIAAFRERHPAIRVRLLDSLNEQVLDRVARGEVDFGVAPQRTTPPEIAQVPLLRDRIDMVCRADHELARRRHVTWKQVLRYPFVSLTRDFTARLQADLAASSTGLRLEPEHEVSYATTALGMVNAGHGITALPTASLPLVRSFGLVAVPVHEPVVHRDVSIFTRRGESLSPAAQSLREYLADYIARR